MYLWISEMYWFTAVHSNQVSMVRKTRISAIFHILAEIRIVFENKILIIINTCRLGFLCSSCLSTGPIVCFHFFQNYQLSVVCPAPCLQLASDEANEHDPTIMKVDLHI